MRRVKVSPEVVQVLPEAVLREIYAGPSPGKFICAVCRTAGDVNSGEEVSLSVRISPRKFMEIVLAHRGHLESQIIFSKEEPDETNLIERSADVVSNAFILYGAVIRPMIYFEQVLRLYPAVNAPDELGPFLDQLLKRGLHHVGRLTSAPPPANGWTLQVSPNETGRILDGSGEVILDTLPPLPMGWLPAVVATQSTFTLLAGRVGTSGLKNIGDHLTGSLILSAKRGLLIGGTVQVAQTHAKEHPADRDRRIRTELADALRESLEEKAFPDHDRRAGRLAKTPNLVALPGSHRIKIIALRTTTETFPCLILDLNVKSDTLASSLLEDLELGGLSRLREFPSPFPFAAPGWSHISWRAQILIFAGELPGGPRRKLLFEEVGVGEWYSLVSASAGQVLGILVGNFRADLALDLEHIQQVMRTGGVVGAALPGIVTG